MPQLQASASGPGLHRKQSRWSHLSTKIRRDLLRLIAYPLHEEIKHEPHCETHMHLRLKKQTINWGTSYGDLTSWLSVTPKNGSHSTRSHGTCPTERTSPMNDNSICHKDDTQKKKPTKTKPLISQNSKIKIHKDTKKENRKHRARSKNM